MAISHVRLQDAVLHREKLNIVMSVAIIHVNIISTLMNMTHLLRIESENQIWKKPNGQALRRIILNSGKKQKFFRICFLTIMTGAGKISFV